MHRRSFLAMTSLIAGMSAVRAQPDMRLRSREALWQSASPTHRFEQRRFDSADGLRRYLVFVAVPVGEAPSGGWPAIYMLDGNAAFDDLRQPDLDLVPGHALIGIGYDIDKRHDTNARTLDYTPPTPSGIPADPGAAEAASGGADVFLALLAEQMLPALAKEFSLNPARRMLWGHSYGGLFVLNALFKRPDLFRSYHAVSPSLWWRAPLMLQLEETSKRGPEGGAELQVLYEVTEDSRGDERRKLRMAQGRAMLEEMLKKLAARPDIALQQRAYPGENHGSMFQVGLKAALARGVAG